MVVGGEKRVCIKSWRERRKKIECEPRPTPAQRCARKPPPSIHQLPSHLRPPSLSVGGWRRRRRKMSTSNALAKILSRGKFSLLPSCRGKREGRVRACRALICQPPRGRSLPPLRCQPREVPFLPLFQNGISFYLRRPTGGASGLCQTSTTALFSSFRSPFTSVAREGRAKRGK